MNQDLQDMLLFIFEEGLDEDAQYRFSREPNFPSIEQERLKLSDESLEAKLIDLLIQDYKNKGDIKW